MRRRWSIARDDSLTLGTARLKDQAVLKLVRLPTKAGADVNAMPFGTYHDNPRMEAEHTTLQAAATTGYSDLVRILVEADADVNADVIPPQGISAIDAAARFGDRELVELLLIQELKCMSRAEPTATCQLLFQ